jgi:hypothetical protein
MATLHTPEKITDFPSSLIINMVTLATGGFGVVVALAWTEVIKAVIKDYVDPWLGKNGSLISLTVYAIVMTLLAVFVTMQLTGLQKKITSISDRLTKKKSTEK